jgi:ferredoxin
MTHRIVADLCAACGACEAECPVGAIRQKGAVFIIDPKICVDCVGHFDQPRCVEVCPTDACVPAE